MTLDEALNQIHAPKGMTSLIDGIMSGDFDSIREQDATDTTLEMARAKLTLAKDAQANCKSDAAYWGYQGDVSYWKAVVSLLEAAAIVGPENLPNVEPPRLGGIVMDDCHHVEQFGARVLAAATPESDPTGSVNPETEASQIQEGR